MGGKRIYLSGALALALSFVSSSDGAVFADTAQPSSLVTLTCTGSPCPWGASVSGQGIVWPASMSPSSARLGYTASGGVYLPASTASGTRIAVSTGAATVLAGLPGVAAHRVLASLSAGQSYVVTGLGVGDVVSVQSASTFSYVLTPAPPPPPPPPGSTASSFVTLTCTGTPCPWGASLSGHVIVWPGSMAPSNTRLGYTASAPVYLPGSNANGATIQITTGSATVLAGLPSSSSHRTLASLSAGQSYVVAGVAAGEIVSVQSAQAFSFVVTPAPPPPPPPPGSTASTAVTLTCTGSPCPWGASANGHAIVWPAELAPSSARLGYTASAPVYLPATSASGMTIQVTTGSATVLAGAPTALSHRTLATLTAGQSYVVAGVTAGEVVSVQNSLLFSYVTTAAADPPPPPPPACPDPTTCDPVTIIQAYWRCNIVGCTEPDWIGGAVTWPSWAAYHDNIRVGSQSRSVFTATGEPAYPYMGSWADGCEVTAVTGFALVIEWQRGTDVWRETFLDPGQSYTIDLISPEDGALIEGAAGGSVSLENCTPQPVP